MAYWSATGMTIGSLNPSSGYKAVDTLNNAASYLVKRQTTHRSSMKVPYNPRVPKGHKPRLRIRQKIK